MRPSFVLHSHFYQPPREDPRTDRVPVERSAAPYHDWNERIHAECYEPLTATRILDGEGRIREIANSLEWMSWDAGATLMRWLAREKPVTYRAFLEADARSRGRLGFGNALAAPYHHVILPLASRRDKITEVRWGLEDFRRRFGREPEGMWLPETAVDTETLEILAREGIAFTILAPDQVEARPAGGRPGRVRLGGGRSMTVFVYDGALSHGIAFGALLHDAGTWIASVEEGAAEPDAQVLSLATDGETFGHHHRWSDMALVATLTGLATRGRVRVENFASVLGRSPLLEDVTLVEPSSWSCSHGVDRWRRDCGCKMAPEVESQQEWRSALRESLEELAGGIHELYEAEAGKTFDDPWAVRDDYGSVLDGGPRARSAFVREQAREPLGAAGIERALQLLEMEHDALRMFTSCGWFFDDLAGLEPLQVLRYAAHAIDLAGSAAVGWEERLAAGLSAARSNDPEAGDGRRLWRERIRTPPEPLDAWSAEEGGGAPAHGRLERALRAFLRAPGDDAAAAVIAIAEREEERALAEILAAQTAFARSAWRGPEPPTRAERSVAHALGFGDSFFAPRAIGGSGPVGFVFGLHLHQPAGNFDSVFESHTEEVYLPFLERLAERELLPLTLHVSGPLLEWLDARGHRFLDLIGRLAADGSLEMLLSGFYEPVLPALPSAQRIEQIGWMREWLASRLGVAARGLWLTERVWEPGLVEDLVDAGVDHALVDDRHFLVAGFETESLHRPFRTESGGRAMALLPIDERLRYLVPFRPPEELARYFRALRAADHPLAILADDGEKFGGWPGTAEWVWRSGWLESFLDVMTKLVDEDVVQLTTTGGAVESVAPSGPAYLPSASYREMEGWSLPAPAALQLESLERASAETEGADRFVRGGHWRNFFAIYPESHRMHAKAQALAALCRRKGDPPGPLRAIGRAQCNDAYWHGVFGGLYLRHLRAANWRSLAEAEAGLRAGEDLAVEPLDLDGDGSADLWIHSAAMSCIVGPSRGGAILELTRFEERVNLADVLTRRWESYHRARHGVPAHREPSPDGGAPSIHEIEQGLGFEELPPFDPDDRALTVERVLPRDVTPEAYALADYDAIVSWARAPTQVAHDVSSERVEIRTVADEPESLAKDLSVEADGSVEIRYRWDPASFPPDAWFAPELSLAADVDLSLDPPAEVWRYDITTLSKSESGHELTVQGVSRTPLWPCSLGEARLRIGALAR